MRLERCIWVRRALGLAAFEALRLLNLLFFLLGILWVLEMLFPLCVWPVLESARQGGRVGRAQGYRHGVDSRSPISCVSFDGAAYRAERRGVSERSFTHLHTHTEFSMFYGVARVKDLVSAADGMPALGIMDHGTCNGVLDFSRPAEDAVHHPRHRDRGLHLAATSARVPLPGSTTPAATRCGRKKLYYHLSYPPWRRTSRATATS